MTIRLSIVSVEGRDSTKYKLRMKDGSAGGFIWITSQGRRAAARE